MTNPAGARRQVLGVFNADLCPVMAAALQGLGSEHVMVVHGTDGLDEISICEPTEVCELKDGTLRSYQIDPKSLAITTHPSMAFLYLLLRSRRAYQIGIGR